MEEVGQVRVGSHLQPLRYPGESHRRFAMQTQGDFDLLRVAFEPPAKVLLLPPQLAQLLQRYALGLGCFARPDDSETARSWPRRLAACPALAVWSLAFFCSNRAHQKLRETLFCLLSNPRARLSSRCFCRVGGSSRMINPP